MSTATDIDLDALIDRMLARAAERAGPVLNVNGEDISTLAAAGLVTVNPGDIVASQWGNLVYGQSVTVYASVADRNNQWPAPPDGAVCYTQAEASAWLRRAGQWLPIGSSGQLPLTSGAPFTTATDAGGELWVAKGGVNGGAWKRARNVLNARWYRLAAYGPFPSTAWAQFLMDTKHWDDYGLYAGPGAGSGIFTAPIAGWYELINNLAVSATAAGQNLNAGWWGAVPGTSPLHVQTFTQSSFAGTIGGTAIAVRYFAAGEVSYSGIATTPALSAWIPATAPNQQGGCWLTCRYLGSGT